MNLKSIIFCCLIAVALIVSGLALITARHAARLALADIEIEERNTLMTPVFDQETEKWSYLAIYEVAVTNQGPDAVKLSAIEKVTDGMGFLVPLAGSEILSSVPDYKAFMVAPTLGEIQSNPKLLKEIIGQELGTVGKLDMELASGQSKSVRFGVQTSVYDSENNPTAQVLLVSFRLKFDNGKMQVFRRGFPVTPLQ
ncbi:MAG TPA: hypothetical protein PLP19_13345 [bacterium]|nr:hypothetical protein [bacterium]HPN44472.1 hypothetical protein [bacterium]